MKKKAELFFAFIKIPIDYFILVLSTLLAYFIRFVGPATEIRPVIFNLPFEQYLITIILLCALWLIFFGWAGLYSFQRRKITAEISRIILACSTGFTAIIIYLFFGRELFSSRFIVLAAWILSLVLITFGRLVMRKFQKICLSHGWGAHQVVIVGKNQNTEEIIQAFKDHPELGYKVVGQIIDFSDANKAQLVALHKKYSLDEIIQTDSTLSRRHSVNLIDFANAHNIIFKYAAGPFEARTTNVEVHMIAGVPLVEIRRTKLDGWGKIIKRLIDFCTSSILIIILSPLFLFIALLIKLEDWGPAIYKNERVASQGKKLFNVYKFRSMYTRYCVGRQFARQTDQKTILKYEQELIKKQSERQGPLYKVLNDPRRTKIGRWLERTSLDELPQLFNVWIGNMSLVGPRPHQLREVELYKKHHRHVLDIKPGITGLAQISGRSDLHFEDEVKLDTYYIENWKLSLDFWILLRTPWIVLRRKSRI